MLITKEVEMHWIARDVNFYKSKGYIFTGIRDKFMVKVEDLPLSSKAKIQVKCDYCGEILYKYYVDFLKSHKTINKDTCSKCLPFKNKDILKYKLDNNLIDKNTKGYWKEKKNILYELQQYIDKNKKLDGITANEEGKKICAGIYGNKYKIEDLIIELGYTIEDLYIFKPEGYYDDFDVLAKTIQTNFIDKFNRFPTQDEIYKNLNISVRILAKHGGIYEIKRKMNYDDKNNLKDDNNYYNKSRYEYMLAQWLINSTNIEYKRDILLSNNKEDGKYNCDFVLYPKNHEPIWIEIWGYTSSAKSKRTNSYKDKMSKKIKLYEKYNYILVSFYESDFNIPIHKIPDMLYSKLKDFIDLEYEKIQLEKLYIPLEITDEDIYKIFMKHSKDNKTLPTKKVLIENNLWYLYSEILRRYKSYYIFSNKMNAKVNYNEWDNDRITDLFKYLLKKYGRILNSSEINKLNDKNNPNKDEKLYGFEGAVSRHGGFVTCRLSFYDYCLKNNITLPDSEIYYIKQIARINKCSFSHFISEEQTESALKLLLRL